MYCGVCCVMRMEKIHSYGDELRPPAVVYPAVLSLCRRCKAVTVQYEDDVMLLAAQILKTYLDAQWNVVEQQSCAVPHGNLIWYIL